MTPIHIKEVFWVTVKRVRKAHVYRINHCKLVPASAVKKQQTKKRSIIHDFKICLLSPFQKQRPSRKEKNSCQEQMQGGWQLSCNSHPHPPVTWSHQLRVVFFSRFPHPGGWLHRADRSECYKKDNHALNSKTKITLSICPIFEYNVCKYLAYYLLCWI